MTFRSASFVLIALVALSISPSLAFADEATTTPADASSTPPIVATSTQVTTATTTAPLTIEGTVDVSAACDVTDTDGAVHTYTAASSTAYVAICALDAAQKSGVISSVGFSNQYPSMGLFVIRINDVTADAASQYWALYQNDGFASLGLSSLPVTVGDTIMLQLQDFSGTDLGDQLTLHINSLIATTEATSTPPVDAPPATSTGGSSGGGGGGGGIVHVSLNIPQALAFLSSKQHADGSFDYYDSDWAALAFSAADTGSTGSPQTVIAKAALKNYLQTASPAMNSITDFERHAMALEALDIDPYSGAHTDYLTPIVKAFDGTQIGDASLDNDDIFAVFPLLHAGYVPSDPLLIQEARSILAKQLPDGSWDESPDMTAAAASALGNFLGLSVVDQTELHAKLDMAHAYLSSKQQQDGGWGNPDSTSWVQAMTNSLLAQDTARAPSFYNSAGQLPNDAIAHAQYPDGGVRAPTDTADRVLSTSYAIVAASGKSWDNVLAHFPKPSAAPQTAGGSIGLVLGAATSTVTATASPATAATSTSPALEGTTTPTVATSSPATSGIASSTESSPAPTVHKKIVKKTKTAVKPSVQLAAAAPLPSPIPDTTQNDPGLISRAWHALVSFLGRIL